MLALFKYEDYHSGDNFQYYSQTNARPNYRFDENQQPIVVGAWHHEWAPGMHTLVLAGRLITEQYFSDKAAPQLGLWQYPSGALDTTVTEPFDVVYHNQIEIYTAELNQIFTWDRVTLSAGARYQTGSIQTYARLTNPGGLANLFSDPAAAGSFTEDVERFTGYGYLTVEPLDRLWLTGGLAYDDETYPRNFREPPIGPGEDHRSQLGPKAALVWSPLPQATLRGSFTRSLGGVSLDESYRLEPTQLAGFPQAFRSLIPESVPGVGSVDAPEYQTAGLALDFKFPTRTYAGIDAERLESNVRRSIGVFSLVNAQRPFVPSSTRENLDYRENSLAVSLDQLVGDMVVLGASYKFDQVELRDVYPQIPVSVLPSARRTFDADLHEATGFIVLNHPSGFFARAEAQWYHQHNSGYTPPLPGDDFVQENLYLGYRFLRRRAELMLGVLDLSGQDYRLNPLNTYMELPRERSYIVRLNFVF